MMTTKIYHQVRRHVQASLQAWPLKLQADSVFGKKGMAKAQGTNYAIQDH